MQKLQFSLKIVVDKSRCIGCGICVDLCPSNLYRLSEEKKAYLVENFRDDCFICHSCAVSCPTGAITVEEDVAFS
jgi:NAD-dependent dihydropyrimidine dehydrogenase PreA subunit